MEGIYFYWFSWIAWVYATFIMQKSVARTKIAIFILVSIIFSNTTYSFYHVSFTISYVWLLFCSYLYIAKWKKSKLLYYLICSLILTIAYSSFYLLELFDPIWLFFDRKWMLSFFLLYLLLMLVKGFYDRIIIAIISVCNGELLNSIIFQRISVSLQIGGYSFLDTLVIFMMFIVLWSLLERMVQAVERLVRKEKIRRMS